LKDAAAAVYGARAANGVILVTTKKGKQGAPRISYSGSFGIADEISRPSMLSAYDFGRLVNIVTARNPKNASLDNLTQLFQNDELEAMKGLNYDLLDKYWKTGYTQKHNVNVSGATDNVNYFASVGYFKQDGNMGNLDYDRWNYRAGVDVKISKWLSANLNVSGDYGKKNSPYVSVGGSGTEDYQRLLTRSYYLPEYVNGKALLPYGISNTADGNNLRIYHYDLLQNSGDFTENMDNNSTINGRISYDFGWSKILQGLKVSF
jgi:TonB-dependent SusC/RagA subfamily outer membrane receptor